VLPPIDPTANEPKLSPEPPTPLPGEPQPIDLPTALRLADVQNPEIAVARTRIQEALARQDLAELLWVPHFELGETWARHDGQIQRAAGEVFRTTRSSLFVGGYTALNLPLAEALYAPLAARQITAARRAGAEGVANERLLEVALAYLDLLQALAEVSINDETLANARVLLDLTENYERTGKGVPADTARARTEATRRERQRVEVQGRLAVASARLARLLLLPADLPLRPTDPAVVPIALVPEDLPLAELVAQALAGRPELAENRAEIGAALERWRAAKVAPWVPRLRLEYAAGGFGGGQDEFFGDFDGRGDVAATAVWQFQNFGLGNLALMRERRAQYNETALRQAGLEARVAAQVVAAFSEAFARRRQLGISQREVAAARDSYQLNERRIRQAPEQARPIELLQAIQALFQARQDYLQVVLDYNRAQFRLYTALGNPPLCALPSAAALPVTEPTVPDKTMSPEEAPRPRPVPDGKENR
jgi:outer membrane protein TolC